MPLPNGLKELRPEFPFGTRTSPEPAEAKPVIPHYADVVTAAQITLGDLMVRRQPLAAGGSGGGGDAHRLIELYGGELVPCLHYEPDPLTFRSDYYYHSGLNVLYRKILTTDHPEQGIVRGYWKQVSQ